MIRNTTPFVLLLLGSTLSHTSLKLYPRTRVDGSIPPTRSMVIILDESEKNGLGAATYSALVALYQQVCPVLVSTSVIKTLFTLEEPNELIRKELHLPQQSLETISYRIKKTFIANFDPAAFAFYVVNPALLLFIPHQYIKTLGSLPPSSKNFSSLELLLGLKVDHVQNINFKQIQEIMDSHKSRIPSKYFGKEALYGEKITSDSGVIDSPLFITSALYENKRLIPQWVIYLTGHGEQAQQDTLIAGLNIPWFRKVLDFLNFKIMTKFFVYISCYSTGTTLDTIYKNSSNPAFDQYQFPIATAGVANLRTVVYPAVKIEAPHAEPTFSLRFNNFFQQAMANNPIGYEHIIPFVFTGLDYLLPPQYQKSSYPNLLFNPYNFPIIRPAERDFFVPLVPVLHINPIMLAHRTQPLDIQQYAHTSNALTDQLYVMIDVEIVTLPLIVQRTKTAPVIASSLQQTIQLMHLQTDYSLQNLLQERAFIGNPGSTPFLIHTFIGNTKQQRYTNVIISMSQEGLPQATATTPHGEVIVVDKASMRSTTPTEKSEYLQQITTISAQKFSKETAEHIHELQQVVIHPRNQPLLDAITKSDHATARKFMEEHASVVDELVIQHIDRAYRQAFEDEQKKKLSLIYTEALEHYRNNHQKILDELFHAIKGDVAAQYRLLTIIKNAPTSSIYQKQCNALIILRQTIGLSTALGLLRGWVEQDDWREGRKTIRWQRRWQLEGQIQVPQPHEVFTYAQLKEQLQPWNTVMHTITQEATRISPPEFDQLCVHIFKGLETQQSSETIIKTGIARLRE